MDFAGHFQVKFLDRRWKYLITYLQILQFSICRPVRGSSFFATTVNV